MDEPCDSKESGISDGALAALALQLRSGSEPKLTVFSLPRSVFSLPATLSAGDEEPLRLPVRATTRPAERAAVADAVIPSDGSCLSCIACGEVGLGREAMVEHCASDWHRYNLRCKAAGRPTLTEVEFEEKETLSDGSISGSAASESDEESSEADAPQPARGTVHFVASSPYNLRFALLRAAVPTGRPGEQSWWAVVMLAGGHFVGALFEDETLRFHKTFHRYTTRRKQGGSQSRHDNQGRKAKSAGAQIRRYNEMMLTREITEQFEAWGETLRYCSVFWFAASRTARGVLFASPTVAALRRDGRVRRIPLQTRRPTLAEARRVHGALAAVCVTDTRAESGGATMPKKHDKRAEHATLTETQAGVSANESGLFPHAIPPVAIPPLLPSPPPPPPPALIVACRNGNEEVVHKVLDELSRDGRTAASIVDESNGETALHAATIADSVELVTLLLRNGADPATRDHRGRVPYALATSKRVRDSFRRAMGDYLASIEAGDVAKTVVDWHAAGVPGPLTDEMASEKRRKQREKKKRQQARKKKDKAEAQERLVRQQKEQRERVEAAKANAPRCSNCDASLFGIKRVSEQSV